MPDTLDAQLDGIFAARDRDDMRPTIDALVPLFEQHPENARVLYELGGAYDTAGEEATALGFYERSLERGLAGDLLCRCYLQWGSTLLYLVADQVDAPELERYKPALRGNADDLASLDSGPQE